MSREVHVRFWESAGVRFPRATQLEVAYSFHSENVTDAHVFCILESWKEGASKGKRSVFLLQG